MDLGLDLEVMSIARLTCDDAGRNVSSGRAVSSSVPSLRSCIKGSAGPGVRGLGWEAAAG